ncbi:MAG TPA: hypothetical protein VJO35_09515 [Terriglobales bacterium]|nr:hypothetical protein [Terriglobales bacterium]
MADTGYQTVSIRPGRTLNWSAIWAGVFSFVAVWSVFGLLGMAIFASAANPNAQQPVTGMNVGMAIWAIILTIIAMYVAGRITGSLASINTRYEGVNHGLIMFGLSVVAVIVLSTLGGAALSGGAGVSGAHNPYVLGVFAGFGWAGFLSLFLGWLAAMGGASTGSHSRELPARSTTEPENVQRIRPAA